MAEEVYNGKIVQTVSYVWSVQNYKEQRHVGYGVALESPAFEGPDGHSFKIKFYPSGATQEDYIDYFAAFAIESTQTAELLVSFRIVNPYPFSPNVKTSSFHKRGFYRRVLTVQAGHTSPCLHVFTPYLKACIGMRYSLKIKATIGVFTNTDDPLVDRCLFFQVGYMRFFAEQSIVQKRCPALLLNADSDADIVISDVEPDLFDALLWFIYNKKVHSRDLQDIQKSNWRDPNSFRMQIRTLSIRYQLPGFADNAEVYLEDLYRPFLKAWSTVRRITSKVAKVKPDPKAK
ncbi:uncharacterized protein LOC125210512 [Salvia hispanica]|uniref:uncharacterized protein LOC125210512 n=1 Tax=Salvia hispanica TaxID=49212 RepID=UPI002009705F|nr:uncharacterized protein LOC125210512 [Salvia hispanica]